ncbi:MAG: hypothetical protein ROO71_08890 [Balneola sp.]
MPNSRLQNHIGIVEGYKGKEFICVESGNLLRTDLDHIQIFSDGSIEAKCYYGSDEETYWGSLFDGKNWAKIIE